MHDSINQPCLFHIDILLANRRYCQMLCMRLFFRLNTPDGNDSISIAAGYGHRRAKTPFLPAWQQDQKWGDIFTVIFTVEGCGGRKIHRKKWRKSLLYVFVISHWSHGPILNNSERYCLYDWAYRNLNHFASGVRRIRGNDIQEFNCRNAFDNAIAYPIICGDAQIYRYCNRSQVWKMKQHCLRFWQILPVLGLRFCSLWPCALCHCIPQDDGPWEYYNAYRRQPLGG